MKLLKQYWFPLAFGLALIIGVGIAHWSFNNLVEPSSPYMIVDKDAPSDYSPVGYEPVEMTGKQISEGKKVMVSCKVPESYTPYIHYPDNWNDNALNPETQKGTIVKYGLFGFLALMVGFLTWRITRIVRIYKKKQGGKI